MCLDHGTATGSLHAVGEQASGTVGPAKGTALTRKHSALGWGFFLSMLKSCTHTWDPHRKLMQRGSAVKMQLAKYLWALAIYMFIPSILHTGSCLRTNGCLRPRLQTCLVCPLPTCHRQAAQLQAESNMVIKQRKHESHISPPKNHSLLCRSAKKEKQTRKKKKQKPTSYSCFQKLSNLILQVISEMTLQAQVLLLSDLPKSYQQLLSCLVPWNSLFSALNNFPSQ